MAVREHLQQLHKGISNWNRWRCANPNIKPDLSGANLRGIRLCGGDRDAGHYSALEDTTGSFIDRFRDGADLRGVNFRGANLIDANFIYCDLSGADLSETVMSRALLGWCIFNESNLYWACLDEARAHHAIFKNSNLDRVNFGCADLASAIIDGCSAVDITLFDCELSNTEFRSTNLIDSDLIQSRLIGTRFVGGKLSGCSIYGVSVWDVSVDNTAISDLNISPRGLPRISVDDLDVAQFLYLMLDNKRLRNIVETMTSKIVLIIGRFTVERKAVLDMLRDALRKQGFVSILFDFDKPASRDITEVVSLIAHMSCFVLADITDPKSIPQELQRIVPSLPSVPVQPLILLNNEIYSMFVDFGGSLTMLPPIVYKNDKHLISLIDESILPAVNKKLTEIRDRRNEFERAISRATQYKDD
ncbi:pentapeptide repeat-containing protein [Methylobacterium sp. EM32]|uniref:pentapeptide repeat-containing protein n=1 Tax=Methylobacterium sp. EM32 TaxID=3163481 RepID=UPI0033B46167